MSPKRIQELLQVLWEEVDSDEDLQKFIETYGDELEQDFLGGIAAVVQNAEENKEEKVARFFRQMGQAFVPLLIPSGAKVRGISATELTRGMALVQILMDEVRSNKDFVRFAEEHLHELDDVFFAALQHVAEKEKADGNEEKAMALDQTGGILRKLYQAAEE